MDKTLQDINYQQIKADLSALAISRMAKHTTLHDKIFHGGRAITGPLDTQSYTSNQVPANNKHHLPVKSILFDGLVRENEIKK